METYKILTGKKRLNSEKKYNNSRKQQLPIERNQLETVQEEFSTRDKKTFLQPKNC